MLHKRLNPVVTFFLLLALFGVSKPAKAFILAQADGASTTFAAPDKLPQDAKINIAASNSTDGVSSGLQESFVAKYPQATVNVNTQDSGEALNSLASGEADIAAIGRLLTEEEKARGLTSVPISREKIAIVVSPENTYDGNLTIEQFAQIFRGEITDWSEIGGAPGAIQLVDLPDTNDTRQAFPNYPVFQSAEFSTGSNTTKLDEDSNDAMVAELGENGIGYAVAGDVIDRDDVKIVTMHQTQPDDPRYPFSQPFSLVYQGTPSEAAQAYLGFAGSEGTEEIVASRVGSISPSTVAAVVSGAGVGSGLANGNADSATDTPVDNANPEADLDKIEADVDAVGEDAATNADKAAADLDKVEADTDAVGEDVNEDIDPNASGDEKAIADAKIDTEGSGEVNPDVEGSGEVNPDVEGSGEVNPDIEGGGELNSELEDSGKVNVDVEDSGKVNVDVEGSGEPLNSDVEGADGEAAAPNEAVGGEIEVAEKKGGRWWLWLLPLLAIPILGALLFGGKKRSDREPALDNVPDPNRPDGGNYVSGRPEDGGVPPVGANVSGNAEREAETGTTTNRMGSAGLAAGGAALAGGAAAAAAKRGDRDIDPDLDIDRSPTAAEIPSNPVTEFTGQETKLQVSDQSTKLQASEDYDLDTDAETDGDIAAGGASSMFEREENRDRSDLNFDETSTGSITANSTNATNPVGTDVVSAEFAGDYVLPEEIKTDGDTDLDSRNNSSGVDIPAGRTIETPETNLDSDRNLEGKGAETYNDITTPEVDVPSVESTRNGETEILNRADRGTNDAIPDARPTVSEEDWTSDSGATAASDTFNRDRGVGVDDTVIAADDATQDTKLNVGNRLDDATASDMDVDLDANRAETDFSLDADPDLDRGTGTLGNASKIGGATALGGAAAAASGMLNRDRDENVDDSAQDTELNVGNRLDDVTASDIDVAPDGGTAETDFSLDADPDLDRGTGTLGNASKIGGAAALGGAAAAASGMLNRDRDENVDDSAQDTELNVGNRLDDVTASDIDVAPDGGTAETDFSFDADLDRGTGTVDRVRDTEGAATSGVFNRDRDENVDDSIQDTELNPNTPANSDKLENIIDLRQNDSRADLSDLDTSVDSSREVGLADNLSDLEVDRSSETFERDTERNTSDNEEFEAFETSFDSKTDDNPVNFTDNVVADAETVDTRSQDANLENVGNSADLDLESMDFGLQDDNTINASLEEISFDDAATDADDLTLEEISQSGNTTGNVNSENVNLETNTADIRLDEISFDEATTDSGDPTLEDLNLDAEDKDISLDDLGFEESTQTNTDRNTTDFNLSSDRPVDTSNLANDRSNDMNNISEWLDSLETPIQNNDNITDWLETLDKDTNTNVVQSSPNKEASTNLEAEADDISFQFLEDLLERDDKEKRNDG